MEDPAIYLIVGVFVVLAAWIPLFLGQLPLSLPMIAVGGGFLLGLIVHSGDPFGPPADLLRTLSEFALLVSVLGAGLKIDRKFSLFKWLSTWRLLIVVMPLSITAIALAAHVFLGAAWGVAIIFGAALAPTDPVLASDYSSGPPGVGEEGETKFALTSEAGLNDGLAYPFVVLGVMLAGAAAATTRDFTRWILVDLLWNVVGAAIVGVALGYALTQVNAILPPERRLSASNSGIVAVGLAFLAYALAGYAHANGFIAVFCEAVAIRNLNRRFEYSRRLDHAAGQFERIAMTLVLALLGVSLTRGLLENIGWLDAAFAAVALLLVRPIAVAIAFIGSREDRWTRAALGYFGLRGIASLYYAAAVAPQLSGAAAGQLTTIVSFVIFASIMFYGMTAHVVAGALTGGEHEFEK